ncbi:MAG: DUF4112 domain-containing protein [Pseudomonadota bacterium]
MSRTITMRRSDKDGSFSAKPSTQELDNLAHWLDSKFSLFGIRFGLDSIVGLVPGIGDLVGLGLSSTIIAQGVRLGARKRTIARMVANVAGDTIVGSIPVLGTVVDVMWKANRANMKLLRHDLERANPVRRF